MRIRALELDQEEDEAMQRAWESLTTALLQKGYGYLWMKHFLDTEFNRLIEDPVRRKRMGVEPKRADGEETK